MSRRYERRQGRSSVVYWQWYQTQHVGEQREENRDGWQYGKYTSKVEYGLGGSISVVLTRRSMHMGKRRGVELATNHHSYSDENQQYSNNSSGCA